MKYRQSIVFLFCLVWIFSACKENTLYHSYQSIKRTGWEKMDTISFHLPSRIPNGEYDMQIGIRFSERYPYQDIWLEAGHANDSLIVSKDTLHLYLATEKGEWKGEGFGGLKQYTYIAPQPFTIQNPEKRMRFIINHLMSDSILKEVYDIGIQLTLKP